jgi:hypothetical protein
MHGHAIEPLSVGSEGAAVPASASTSSASRQREIIELSDDESVANPTPAVTALLSPEDLHPHPRRRPNNIATTPVAACSRSSAPAIHPAAAPPLAAAAAAAASPPPSAAGVWAPLRSLLTPLPFALLRAGAASLPPGRARDAEADAAAVPHAAGVLLPAPPSLPLPLPPQLLLLPAAPRPMDASVRCFAADGGTPASAAAAAS